jgi:tryptophanyl-tRNA synthetase
MTAATVVTGVQPTGELHLGNYAGAIRPLAQLAARPPRETYVFVAGLHGLNRRPDPDPLRERIRTMAAALLACGLDHDRVHLFRQLRVPAIGQLSALLRAAAAGLAPCATPARGGTRP